jgi:hypothetical protein
MIKKYLSFIKENNFGEYVERHMNNKDIERMIMPFLDGYEKDLNISNIVELLDDNKKNEIKIIINNYLKNGLKPKEDVNISVSTQIQESSGKGVFSTFLKALSALNIVLSKKPIEDYLLYIESENIDHDKAKSVFNRFKSLLFYFNEIKESNQKIKMYYGLKNDLMLEYGLYINDKPYIFGYFKVSKSNYNWILNQPLKALSIIKNELKNLTYENLNIFSRIKKDIKNIAIFDYKKIIEPSISNDIIKWGYYGVGSWKNGNIDELELNDYKNIIKKWIINNKWGNSVVYKIHANDFWLIIEIKNK